MATGNGNGKANGRPGMLDVIESRIAGIPDRVPPQNLEAERSVLGSILLEPDRLPEVMTVLEVGDFYLASHQVLFQALLDLYDEETPIDAVTLGEMLERQNRLDLAGGNEGMREVVESVPHAANAVFYAKIVRERARARRLVEGASELLGDAFSNQYTIDDLVDRMTRQTVILSDRGDEDDGMDLPGGWPEEMAPEAYQGVAGEIVRRILPLTEADPAALLAQFLCAFGNAVGYGPHWRLGATRHGVNLFVAIVGRSSRARKGTSWDFVQQIMRHADPDWGGNRILSGLATGEGMIERVRDARYKREKVEGAPALGGGGFRDVEIDPGESDKRALWIESEFGATLSLKGRDGNILDGIVKKFWESGTVQSSSKANPSRCTNAHVSIIGHVTVRELLRKLSDVDVAGGFANRFLWVCSRRTKILARPGPFKVNDFLDLIQRVKDALDGVRFTDWEAPMTLSAEAWALWEALYRELGQDRPGILDDLCARAEPQTLRLAALYALLDNSTRIEVEHLRAAHAFWRYCEASLVCIFGEQAHDDPNEVKLLEALRSAPAGLTATDVRRRVFHGKLDKPETSRILGSLVRAGKISRRVVKTPGRDRTVWVLNTGSQDPRTGT